MTGRGAADRAAGNEEEDEEMIAISGNTYPVRDQLKALGGKWDPAKKAGWCRPPRPTRRGALSPPPGSGIRRWNISAGGAGGCSPSMTGCIVDARD
jgi:hypothetical protein